LSVLCINEHVYLPEMHTHTETIYNYNTERLQSKHFYILK